MMKQNPRERLLIITQYMCVQTILCLCVCLLVVIFLNENYLITSSFLHKCTHTKGNHVQQQQQ